MIKHIKYTLLSIGIVLIASCTDIEEDPIGLLAPESFFSSLQDVSTSVTGGYGYLASEEFWGRKFTLSIMLRGDMIDIGDQGTSVRRIQVNNFQMDDENGMVAEFWPRIYAMIGTVNYAIDGAKLVNEPPERLNPIVAEGHFLRAFGYYHLVRVFGEVPLIDFSVTNAEEVSAIEKASVEDIYASIIKDLEFAKQWLPDQQSLPARPSKATAAAYLASVYLTLGQWQNAYDEAKFVLDSRGTFGLALEPDFQTLFDANLSENSSEMLFTVDFFGSNRDGNLDQDYLASLTGMRGAQQLDVQLGRAIGEGWSVAVPSLKVYEDWDSRDYRKAVSFDTVAIMGDTLTHYTFWNQASRGVSRPHIAKYYRFPGNPSTNARNSDHNYPAMRLAEVLLIAAEALNEIEGPNDEAISYINELRQRARNGNGLSNPGTFPMDVASGISKDDFRELVLNERRLELAFECKRWYDIVRRDLGDEVFGPMGFEPQENFSKQRDYLMPLPADELRRNPNLLPQNQGY